MLARRSTHTIERSRMGKHALEALQANESALFADPYHA